MKKFSFVFLILALTIVFTGCKKKVVEETPVIIGVPETGKVIDVTSLNGGQATTTPGDIIYIKLTGEPVSGKQWSLVRFPTSSQLMLKDHLVTGLEDDQASQFTDEWRIKIEETGEFLLKFDYGITNEEAEFIYEINIISQ